MIIVIIIIIVVVDDVSMYITMIMIQRFLNLSWIYWTS